MMRVPTYVAPSRIPGAGMGLFCAGSIGAGDLLWVFDSGLDIEIRMMPDDPVVADFLRTYAYMPREGEQRWILCGDNARFFNHSDTPNVIGDEWISHAATDLAADTELTIDYGTFDRRPIEFWI
jgi:hypothetical protein